MKNLNNTVLAIFFVCIALLSTLVILVKVNNTKIASKSDLQQYLNSTVEVDTIEVSMNDYVQFDALHIHERTDFNVFWTVSGELIVYTAYRLQWLAITQARKRVLLITRPATMENGNLLNDEYFSLARLETAVKSKSRCIYISTDSERMFEIAENATHMFKGRKMHSQRKFSFINSNGCEVIYEFTELPETWAEDKR